MNTQTLIQLIAYALSVGCLYGAVSARLSVLEKKVDVHNHLIDRMYRAERDISLISQRLNNGKNNRKEE